MVFMMCCVCLGRLWLLVLVRFISCVSVLLWGRE